MSDFQASEIDTKHHIKGLRPALQTMLSLGFSHEDCLENTGINAQQLDNAEQGLSLEQEFRFYRQLLKLTKDPLIGLQLGQAYRLESYGVFGYAILSAKTLGDALKIASKFSRLSFSHFDIKFEVIGSNAHFQMLPSSLIEEDLLTLYEDRDCAAILAGAGNALGQSFPLIAIRLMHEGTRYQQDYERFYGCPVSFKHTHMEVIFDASFLKQHMPLRDPDTAEYCRRQCDKLLNTLEPKSSCSVLVKEHLFSSSDHGFPSIKDMAEQLHTSERSLRRRLSKEGYSFQALVTEVRFELAQEHLASELSLEDVAQKLGYSEAANFSHAFKRWSGMSPRQYRQQLNNEHNDKDG